MIGWILAGVAVWVVLVVLAAAWVAGATGGSWRRRR